ncbi:MAG: O-antigen ligase family protein [Chthonomonas sp.]|nr:O-antigen ligase family protein [Chthonomonas sp.]
MIRTITGKLLACVGSFALLGATTSVAADALGVNLFGFGSMDVVRNGLACTVIGLLVALFLPRFQDIRAALAILIPVLTQFYQVGLAWDFALGPQSLIRVLPYVGLACALSAELIRRPVCLSRAEQVGFLLCGGVGLLGWVSGLDASAVGFFGFLVFAILLPLLYAYFKQQFASDITAGAQLASASFVSFLALAVGTFVVIKLGSGMSMGGVTGLLGTRNVSDYNLIFAYMLLLWPIALVAASRIGAWCVGVLSVLFLASAVIGLSRTGILLVPLLIIVGIFSLYRRSPVALGSTVLAMAITCLLVWTAMPNRESLGLVWAQRFNISSPEQMASIFSRVKPGGDDSFARDQLRNEALRLWRQDPLIGQGYGGFGAWSVRGYNDAHSVTFTTLAENGLIGLGALYGLFGFLGLRLLRLSFRPLNRGENYRIGAVFLVSFLAWLLAMHSVGGNLAVLSPRSFNVNVINGILMVAYLFVHRLGITTNEKPSESPWLLRSNHQMAPQS